MHSAEPTGHSLSEPALAGPARKVWLLSWAVEAFVLSFVALSAAAMAVYPGGTFWDHARRGHSFWQNFLCDLIQSPALGGAPNVLGAQLATLGMLALVASMVAFVGVVPALLVVPQAMTRQVKLIVSGACGMTACVPLLPSDRFGALHAAAIFTAGIPVALALGVLVAALVRQTTLARWLRALSCALCGFVAAALVLYATELWLDLPPLRVVPVLSRLASLSLVVWLLGLARVARSRSSTGLPAAA